ncbi:MAG: isoprenyl transferase [Bacteroidales bacterium]|nr:isoprenyl transferase [Bacteroidales bacterium]
MTPYKEQIIKEKLPLHIAIIMDGNGRWAKKQHKERIYGHQHGVDAVRAVTEASAELGIKYLTLYTFSKENWNRPKEEVDALMKMLVYTISQEEKTLMDNNIKLETIGDLSEINQETKDALLKTIDNTKNNTRMTLILALNYSSRWEIVKGVKEISKQVKDNKLNIDEIDEKTISNHLTTKNYPDPDLLIRTSGEYRISNYLLWQLAYSELYFTDVLWPDFNKEELYKAIVNYQNRERRFGKISEQIENEKINS